MTISKRTRYEVLRRDSFTCRYCGSKAPDVELHVDHVMPTALGGSDKPDNLVAACRDCNVGKASTDPDAGTVADVSEDAERWARAIKEAARMSDDRSEDDLWFAQKFHDIWYGYSDYMDEEPFPISANWESTVLNYRRGGLSHLGLAESIRSAMTKDGIAPESRYPYFCGVARNRVNALADVAAQLIEGGDI